MATATAYLDRVLPAIDRLAGRFTDLVTSAPDPAAAIPHSHWTVRDAAAHVVTVTRRFVDRPRGARPCRGRGGTAGATASPRWAPRGPAGRGCRPPGAAAGWGRTAW
jgi:hypothetical protein